MKRRNETPVCRHRPRTTAAGAAVVAAALTLAACNEDEAQQAPEQPNVAAAPGEAPADQAPAAEADSEEPEPTESACSRVESCCDAMGNEWGGGSLKKCQQTASAGDEEACTEFLALNEQINAKKGHPLEGEVFAECMPAP